MDPNSAVGPDGLNGLFYQKSWETIKHDLCEFVWSFFSRNSLTKFFTHTCLVLIPKVNAPNSLSQYRPISLCKFSNKIISKILALRITSLLTKIVSENQTGFVKGRLITENILLTQEIIHRIRKENRGGNIVIKLDMSKAYDKLSWAFLTTTLRKMGFSEKTTDLIHNLVGNNWYSIIINGTRHGLFSSSIGIKRGGHYLQLYSS